MPSFEDLFGRRPVATASAPGRVNLIGEHTDYNDGLMLPMPIPQRTSAQVAPVSDGRVRAWSANLGGADAHATYELGSEVRRHEWIDYVQGVTAALRASGLAIGGFDLRLASNVPLGSGLSSSAALMVAVLRGLREAFGLTLDDRALAQLAHRAEVDLVGVPVGIMDQMVCSLGRPGHALLIDARSLTVDDVAVPPDGEIVVVDSNIRHSHASGEYRTRRAECVRACELLGLASLRDLDGHALSSAALGSLPSTLEKRVRHVVSENGRVMRVADALRAGDLHSSGRLLMEGHASLRDGYEVSTPEIDVLVETLADAPGVYGARLTGGGFGGSVVALASRGRGREAGERAAGVYRARTGKTATVLVPQEPSLQVTSDE